MELHKVLESPVWVGKEKSEKIFCAANSNLLRCLASPTHTGAGCFRDPLAAAPCILAIRCCKIFISLFSLPTLIWRPFPMNEKLGSRFRAKREEMNLSLKEVENATSIRAIYLQAIEEGKMNHHLSSVYVLGFMRQYAQFLGFEVDKLVKDFSEAFRLSSEKQEFAYGIGTLERRGSPPSGVRWMPNLLWSSLFLALGIAVWFFGK